MFPEDSLSSRPRGIELGLCGTRCEEVDVRHFMSFQMSKKEESQPRDLDLSGGNHSPGSQACPGWGRIPRRLLPSPEVCDSLKRSYLKSIKTQRIRTPPHLCSTRLQTAWVPPGDGMGWKGLSDDSARKVTGNTSWRHTIPGRALLRPHQDSKHHLPGAMAPEGGGKHWTAWILVHSAPVRDPEPQFLHL